LQAFDEVSHGGAREAVIAMPSVSFHCEQVGVVDRD
jgi:hypothetical protein